MTKVTKKEEKIQVDIDNEDAWNELLNKQGLKVVDIYQEWSGPCEALMSIFRRLKVEINDNFLTFATANADRIDALKSYRDRCEPYFLFFGASYLVGVVKGANAPQIENLVNQLLAQEHEVTDGTRTRTVIEDVYTRKIQETKEAEAQRKALEMVIEQETFPLIISPDFVGTDIANEITDMLQENDFEVAADEERVLTDEVLSVILADEQEDEDFEDRQNLFSRIFEEITPFFALHKTKETKDQEDHAQSSQELDTITEKGRQIESIRDKYGSGDCKAVVKFWETKEIAEKVRKLLFPCFTPAKVITSQQLDEKSEESPEMVKDEDGSVKSSPLEKSEDLKPQLILMVVLPPAAEAFRMEIMATLSEANFDIKVARECTLSEEAAREFCNIMKVDFNSQDLVNDMTSGTTIVVMASKNNAFEAIEEILGPESFSQAKENDPHSLRARYSEIPGTEKINDLPWIYASRSTKETLAWIPHFFPSEETLVGVQPDTTLQETLKTIKHTGFEIVSQKEHTMLEEDVRFLYQEFANHHHLMEDLVNNLNQSVITFLVLRAPAAVISWRTIMGCSDSEAGFAVPNTGEQPPSAIQAMYGKNIMENVVYASTTEASAKQCIEYIFGPNWTAEAENNHDSQSIEEQ